MWIGRKHGIIFPAHLPTGCPGDPLPCSDSCVVQIGYDNINPRPATTYSTSLPRGRHTHQPIVSCAAWQPSPLYKPGYSLHITTRAASYTKASAHPACSFPQALRCTHKLYGMQPPHVHRAPLHHPDTCGDAATQPCRTCSNLTDTCRCCSLCTPF